MASVRSGDTPARPWSMAIWSFSMRAARAHRPWRSIRYTGAVKWKAGNDGAGYSSPVAFDLGGVRCVAIFKADALVGLNCRQRTGAVALSVADQL